MPFPSEESFTSSEPMKFEELQRLRIFSREIRGQQAQSLATFTLGVGFQHVPNGKSDISDISISSSATCILSLVAAGQWSKRVDDSRNLVNKLLEVDSSAGLRKNNPFTTAWIVDAVTALEHMFPGIIDTEGQKRLKAKVATLKRDAGNGGVRISPYPPSAYLTQLVLRVLIKRNLFFSDSKLQKKMFKWAWNEIATQLALVHAKTKTQDPLALAYLVMIVSAITPASDMNPEQVSIQRSSLAAVFDAQLEDGTWPLSRPLFHYPTFGNAYCYEYEMLAQMLQEESLRDQLLAYLPQISVSMKALERNAFHIEQNISAWNSGHHPQIGKPESWATASAFHFVYACDRLLAEAVRRELFRYLNAEPPRFGTPKTEKDHFLDKDTFLDGEILIDGQMVSLRDRVWTGFVEPLSKSAEAILLGRRSENDVPKSAILFGPPGTAKTELSEQIAKFLGWPFLSIDPSLLLGKGLEGIQSEANLVFRMLEETEAVVVLFDEFDELVRERGLAQSDPFSRLLTTAMLPKLNSIRKRGTLVFILATNYINQFDLAIRRPGRFDRVIQVMPPTLEAKLANKRWVFHWKLPELGILQDADAREAIAMLTWGECDLLSRDLGNVNDKEAALELLQIRKKKCTLSAEAVPASGDEIAITWEEQCKRQANNSR